MKKIILGCAAVLLSLGLLAGCNNKEDEPPITEAVSLSVSQTSVNLEPGGSAEVTYTVSPEKATVMALSDHEEYVTAVAQEGTIYLEAVAAGTAIVSVGAEYEDYASAEAQITVTVAEVVEPEPGLPEIELVVDPISEPLVVDGDPVEVTYSVDPEDAEIEMKVANEEYATVEYLDPAVDDLEGLIETAGWYLTPVAEGETTLTVTASLDEYETASVEVAIKVHEEGWEPQSLTYTITIGSLGAAPEGTTLYAAGDFNGTLHDGSDWYDWGEPVELVNNEDATYNLVLDFLPTDGRSFEIIATNPTYDNEDTGSDYWDHVLGSYTITGITDVSNGTTIDITISTEYDSWEVSEGGTNPVFVALGDEETIYVVFLDSSSDDKKVNSTGMEVGTYTVVDNKGNATFKEGATSCTPTMTTTSGSRVAFYTEEVTVRANAAVEFDLYVTVSDVTYHQTSPDLFVPKAEEGKINVLVLGPWFEGWLSDTPTNNEVWWGCNFSSTSGYENSGLGWQTMDDTAQISEFVISISYTYPW